jgi:hypothetical protein
MFVDFQDSMKLVYMTPSELPLIEMIYYKNSKENEAYSFIDGFSSYHLESKGG